MSTLSFLLLLASYFPVKESPMIHQNPSGFGGFCAKGMNSIRLKALRPSPVHCWACLFQVYGKTWTEWLVKYGVRLHDLHLFSPSQFYLLLPVSFLPLPLDNISFSRDVFSPCYSKGFYCDPFMGSVSGKKKERERERLYIKTN